MKPEIIKDETARRKQEALTLFTRLLELSVKLGEPELKGMATALIANINEPYLFVAVGEVKSGKSSLINGLLQDQVCEVAPEPCTDVVQKIVYSDEPFEREITDQVKEIGRPLPILKDIAIVDTPGTNSIIERHQAVTEEFIPQCDLALFVFPALNPYSRTSWELFSLVHGDWRKKIVFILQQADRASEEELAANIAGVAKHASELGVEEPKIFPVSAKLAWDKIEASGIPALWDYINSTVTGGRHFQLKLLSLITTGQDILGRMDKQLDLETQALDSDKAEQAKIEKELERGLGNTARDLDILRSRLADAYQTATLDACQDFEQGLSLFSLFKSTFRGFLSRKNPFQTLITEIHQEFAERFQARVDAISQETGRHVAENLVHFLTRLLEELEQATSQQPESLSATSVAQERLRVVNDATRKVLALMSDTSLEGRIQPGKLKSLGDQTVLGGFLAAIGAIIAAATHTVVFDVTGGVISTLGALLAINTLAWRRRSIIRRFRQGFEKGGEQLNTELKDKLAAQLDGVFKEIRAAFAPFFSSITAMESKIEGLRDSSQDLGQDLERLRDSVDTMAK